MRAKKGFNGARSAPIKPEATDDVEPAHRSARVLVVDDDATNRFVAIRMLEVLGCRAETATNGREAIAAAREHRFDLILMDCWMPEVDGFEATAAIRRLDSAADVPIIALTADVRQEDRERALHAGMNDVQPKPCDLELLGRLLERWVSPNVSEP